MDKEQINGYKISKPLKVMMKMKEQDYMEKVTEEYLADLEILEFNIVYEGQPENYVRERYTNRGNRFYNKKEGIMKEMKKEIGEMVPSDIKKKLDKLIANKDSEYYIYLDADYYLKIPDGDSIKKSVLKEDGIIRPAIRPDLDNYLKLSCDVFHDVLYDDDKRLIEANSKKYYSLQPKTEYRIKIEIIKE